MITSVKKIRKKIAYITKLCVNKSIGIMFLTRRDELLEVIGVSGK